VSYTYSDSAHKHAVTAAGAATYGYDANGSMANRNGTTLTWDLENRLTAVGSSESYANDGDGTRVSKTVSGVTTVYVNKFYEKNVSSGTVTKSYYLGDRLIATNEGGTLRYVHLDSLGSSSVATNTSGTVVGTQTYKPFGETCTSTGTFGTDRKFTGQWLDSSGLYFCDARYYDAVPGRFISPDSVVQTLADPQSLNRYTYVLNNPLRYVDPSGHFAIAWPGLKAALVVATATAVYLTVYAQTGDHDKAAAQITRYVEGMVDSLKKDIEWGQAQVQQFLQAQAKKITVPKEAIVKPGTSEKALKGRLKAAGWKETTYPNGMIEYEDPQTGSKVRIGDDLVNGGRTARVTNPGGGRVDSDGHQAESNDDPNATHIPLTP